MLSEYNNQTILTIKNEEPATDEYALKRRNSLRQIDKKENIQKWYECKDLCQNKKDCVYYDYNNDKAICTLFRKEPFRTIDDLSLNDCTEYCSKDNMCDYLSHSQKNKCMLFSREDNNGKSIIGDLWVDYSVYGYNTDKGFHADNFDDCKDKLNGKNGVFYMPQNYCIPKKLTNPSLGNTAIFFNKTPLDKYEILNDIIGLKSKNREKIDKYKYYFLIIVFIILFYFFYRFSNLFD